MGTPVKKYSDLVGKVSIVIVSRMIPLIQTLKSFLFCINFMELFEFEKLVKVPHM